MSVRDPYNSSDQSALTPSGAQVYRVISVKDDPTKSGRVLAVPHGSMEQYDDRSQYQWIPVSTPFFAQLKGIGISPPHQYEPGTLILVQDTGQQGKIVVGALPNSLNQKGKADTHDESRGTEHKNHNPDGAVTSDPGVNYSVGSTFREIQDQATGWAKRKAEQFYEQTHQHFTGDSEQARSNSETSKNYSKRRMIRNDVINSIGMHQFKGELKSATDFMKQVASPVILESTFAMLDKLKQTAQSGANILANLSVGGIGNITSALSAASSFAAAIQKQNTDNDADPLETFLRALYLKLTGLSAVDANGVVTTAYTIWKAAYLAAQALEQTTGAAIS